MKKLITFVVMMALALNLIGVAAPAFAAGVELREGLDTIGQDVFKESPGGASGTSLTTRISELIKTILSVLGVIMLMLFLYAGWLWMSNRGGKENIGKAKSIMGEAVIGLAIILSAYSITDFVVANLSK